MSQSGPYEFTPPDHEDLGKLLPGYAFEGLIAKGGMGAVYKARQRSLDRDVAFKILPRELGADPEFRKSFETEARAMARLNHANLIGVYDSGDLDGMPFIVMEYVPGKSLYHSAYEKKIDPAEVTRLTLGILAGLGHAHEHGIVHRDIKPANILLTQKAEPKIGDFGLAVPTDTAHTGLVMGTPGYTAPEVIKKPTVADVRSDIFSVGAIFYELLTGHLPGDNPKPPSALCDCPALFDSVFLRATHPNPSFRYPDCKAMASALEAAMKSDKKPVAGSLKTATAAKLATPAKFRDSAKPVLSAPDVASKPPASAKPPEHSLPAIQMQTGSNWGLIRNILIAAAILIVAAAGWKALQGKGQSISKEKRKESKSDWADKYAKQAESDEVPAAPLAPTGKSPAETPVPGESGDTASAKPKPAEPEPEPETPLQALERLRASLVAGQRDKMPPGTARHGESDLLLVPEPMGWDQASLFAEQHGGHLAVPTNNEDLTWLSERIGSGSIWIGAGRNAASKWMMLDGSLWQPELKPRGRGAYAALSDLGLIRGTIGSTPLPFFIQWRRDGANPVIFDALLQKTRESLNLPDPLFPPGSLPCKARRFLLVERPATWAEARNTAEHAGGSLAVISDLEEAFWFEDFISKRKPANGVWIGGSLEGGVWTWITGETWETERWAENQPDKSLKQAAILADPTGKWTSANPNESADGFVIEWSEDGTTNIQKAADIGRIAGGLDPLQKKVRDLVSNALADRDMALAANARNFGWDLDVWLRGLNKTDQTTWKLHVKNLKFKVSNNRTPGRISPDEGIKLSGRMTEITSFAMEKQKKIDKTFGSKLERIRDVYLKRLSNLLANAQHAGHYDLTREIKNAMTKANVDAEALPGSLGIGAAPPPSQ